MTQPMRAATIHDPATYSMALGLEGEGRSRAQTYVCYAVQGCPSNAAYYGPGQGSTEKEALLNACYWANQAPYVRVVPISKAPKWVLCQLQEKAN